MTQDDKLKIKAILKAANMPNASIKGEAWRVAYKLVNNGSWPFNEYEQIRFYWLNLSVSEIMQNHKKILEDSEHKNVVDADNKNYIQQDLF